MGLTGKKAAAILILAAIFIEATLCQASFWTTVAERGTDVTQRAEFSTQDLSVDGLETAVWETAAQTQGEKISVQGRDGTVTIRLKDLNETVDRLHLDLSLPKDVPVLVTVYATDEGNRYPYRLGKGRILLSGVPENAWMKLYPYGKVTDLYIRLETADEKGKGAAGTMGELSFELEGIRINARMPFLFRWPRALAIAAVLGFFYLLRSKSRLHRICFAAEKGNLKGRKKRLAAAAVLTAVLTGAAGIFVQINPDCRQNLAPHHAQYQELAVALSRGKVSVGEADPILSQVENPYDTIYLQANRIPYQADYSYYEGNYYVYFGIVPELLLYFPVYLLTGKALPNYLAVFAFFAGFIAASACLVWEIMRRYFPEVPFYLYGVGMLMLTGSYSLFYLLIRPDLYHVPIIASYMFTAAGIWAYLRGLDCEKGKTAWYAFGSACLALTAGCRPQFLLFSLLAVPMFWKEVFRTRSLFSKKGAGRTLALVLPFAAVGAGLMYYNAIRFGSPFDFGASYSMTSNDMTHRGFNFSRIFYGLWYFLMEPPRMEAAFPYLMSAAIETDYAGRMVSESCLGGIFACSLLSWPVFCLLCPGFWKKEKGIKTAAVSAGVSLFIAAADATGAGILQRYSCDISFGLFLAAVFCLFLLAQQAREKKVYGAFVCWLKAAVLLHVGFLFLVLIQTDGSFNLLTGNPSLYYSIQAMLRL